MPLCPECGGIMRYDRRLKLYVCTSCGIMLTREEIEARSSKWREEEEKSEIEEYYEWWIKSKK